MPNAYGALLQRQGAVGLNAATSHDSTKYYCSLPANKLELWFALEAERFQVAAAAMCFWEGGLAACRLTTGQIAPVKWGSGIGPRGALTWSKGWGRREGMTWTGGALPLSFLPAWCSPAGADFPGAVFREGCGH